jgi:hypothetical protein
MDDDPIRREARRRHELHISHPTHRPLSMDYELVGLRGEEAFCFEFGGSVDMESRPNGDGGRDHWLFLPDRSGERRWFKVDLKTFRKPYHLLVEEGRCVAITIYMLAGYRDDTDRADLLGWEWGKKLLKVKPKTFEHGVWNHYIHRGRLRAIEELKERWRR